MLGEEWAAQRLAASIVARRTQDLERIPVRSAGEDNEASLHIAAHIAAKLGFAEVSRRVDLNTFRARRPSQTNPIDGKK